MKREIYEEVRLMLVMCHLADRLESAKVLDPDEKESFIKDIAEELSLDPVVFTR